MIMKKKFLFIPVVLFISLFFVSCEKESSFENGGSPTDPGNGGSVGGTAAFTFDGGTGNCTGAVISGTITAGAALTSANTVVVEVNVTTVGTYAVTSATVNGVSFSGSGTFASAGVQSITLTGSGTPTNAGTFNLSLGSSGCRFSITVIDLSSIPAIFTLGGAPAACTGFSVGGTYTSGSAVTAANSVTFEVTVTIAGTYSLSSTTVNGITFNSSGVFSTTGPQNVTLKATGTPAAAGSSDFSVTQGTSTCTFSVAVAAPAAFTLSGSPASCTPATVAGTYQNGTALSAANTVTVEVNVTNTGGYTVSTNTVNGITFSTTGSFTTTGPQNIILTGTGTPTTTGTFTFNPQVGTSGCTFDVVVTVAPVPAGTYSCKINGVLFNFIERDPHADVIDEFTSQSRLYLDGSTLPPGSESPEFQIFIEKNDGSGVTTGSYNVDGIAMINGYRIEIDFTDPQLTSTIIWNTSSTILPPANPPFTVNVTEVTATRVKGTFSGQLKHTLDLTDPTIKTVTEGVFDLPIHE